MPPGVTVGAFSPDGQLRWDGAQWVPVERGTRVPTPWTRPMQLAAAALLLVEAVYFVASVLLSVNHDALHQSFQQSNTQIPQGMTEDQLISFVLVIIYVFTVVVALLELFGALGAYLGWRWMFWYVGVLMALGSIAALFGVLGATRSAGAALGELLNLAAVAVLVWMIVGLVRYGPWAMRRPGL
jgi:hypothetical protein